MVISPLFLLYTSSDHIGKTPTRKIQPLYPSDALSTISVCMLKEAKRNSSDYLLACIVLHSFFMNITTLIYP